MKSTLKRLVFASALILLGNLMLIHPFETPDEQAHLATVHYLYIEGRIPRIDDEFDLSKEAQLTEEVFGIMSMGQNKYSFHPEYRMEDATGLVGLYENKIKSYNTPENKNVYSVKQAASYPPLYYAIASIFYRKFYHSDIILRLFMTRFASLLISLFIPLVTFFVGKRILGGNKKA